MTAACGKRCLAFLRLSEMRQSSAESVTHECGDRMSLKKKKTHLGGLKGLGTLGWADLTFFWLDKLIGLIDFGWTKLIKKAIY